MVYMLLIIPFLITFVAFIPKSKGFYNQKFEIKEVLD